MMRTTFLRRTTLHLSQIFFTDGRTFIFSLTVSAGSRRGTSCHLCRYVIRPFEGSYGDTSTVTLSPGRMRM